MNGQPHIDGFLRYRALLAGLLVAGVAHAATPASEVAPAPPPVAMASTYTGELSHAGPVYRLPPVQVIAHRKTGLARMEREERMRQTGVKTTQPSV